MRLATPSSVLEAMGLSESIGTLKSAGRALDLSFPVLEQVLESQLEYATVVDYFDYRGPATWKNYQSYDLRLTRRFLDVDSVVVRYSTDSAPLASASAGVVVEPSLYKVDPGRGVVSLLRPYDNGACVFSVTYDAGFVAGGAIPETLQSMAINAALLALNILPSTVANRKDASVANVTRAIHAHLQFQAAGIERPRMGVEFPCATEYQ